MRSFVRFSVYLLVSSLLCAAGCHSLNTRSANLDRDVSITEIAGPFRVHRNYHPDENDPVIAQLVALNTQVSTALRASATTTSIDVYIFEDRADFEAYARKRLPGVPSRRAYFVAESDERSVFAFRNPELVHDIRHEATHALVHAAVGELPIWLDEGIAEYFEHPGESTGYHREHHEQLKHAIADGWLPGLSRLEAIDSLDQMRSAEYRESWAWVYFLMHHSAGRPLLVEYLAEIRSGANPGPLSARMFRQIANSGNGLRSFLVGIDDQGGTGPDQVLGHDGSDPSSLRNRPRF